MGGRVRCVSGDDSAAVSVSGIVPSGELSLLEDITDRDWTPVRRLTCRTAPRR